MKTAKSGLAILVMMLIGVTFGSCGTGGGMAPEFLRCEYQEGDNILIDTQAPRLSWINNTTQTAWQVLVATDKKALKEGSADIWDSGKMNGSESHLVAYSGPEMTSMEDYWWTVRIWDEDDMASAWAKPAHWTTGMFSESDWKAQWIGASWQDDRDPTADNSAPIFRKEFTVRNGLVRAKAFVTGLGWFEMSVNGDKVGDDFFVPGLTDYMARPELLTNPRIPLEPEVTAYRTLYLAYDITGMLKKGGNAVSMLLGSGYFHEGMFNNNTIANYGYPRFILQMKLEYSDGGIEYVCSDTTWKEAHSPVVFSNLYKGEVYDSNFEIPGWGKPGLDDSSLNYAVLKDAPQGRLTANMGPTDKVIETLKPVSFERLGDGTCKVDFGKVISGWVKLDGVGVNKGDTVRINHLSEYPAGRCEYVCASDGTVTLNPKFTWYVFREAVISGIKDLDASRIVAEAVSSDVRPDAEFDCSNPLFCQIEKIWRQSQIDNMHAGVASDCPHRERLPYTGDGEVAMPMVLANFDAASFYNKWIGDVKGSQNPESGYVPNGAPWEPCCGGGPAWGAAICVMPWEFYNHYGDKTLLESCLGPMKDFMRYYDTWRIEDGTSSFHKPTPQGAPLYWYNLGDWAPAFGLPQDELVHTFFYWLCADITAKTAKVLGHEDDAAEYSKKADGIRDAFNKRYYNPETKSYGDFGGNVYALYMGVPPERLDDVRATLREELMVKYKGHVNVGFVAHRFLYETLALNGMNDVAWTLLNQKDFPSFGWWLEQGATTTWEQWDGTDSRNHPMFGGGLVWFYKMLAGVQTDPYEPGFKHIIIRPVPVKELGDVSYTTRTPYGTLVSKVKVDGDVVRMEGRIPFGAHATIYVPKSADAAILSPLDDSSYEIHEIGPGDYSF